MTQSNLMGYVRKSNDCKTLKISISVEAFEKAEKYHTRDDQGFVKMNINIDKILQLIDGQKEVTGVTQIEGE